MIDIEKIYARYRAHEALYQQYGLYHDVERKEVIQQAKPLGSRILEIGTGQGYFAIALAQQGYCLTGVDISQEELSVADWNLKRTGYDQHVILKKINDHQLPFASQAFDVVFLIKVLHHLMEPFLVIDEMIRVLTVDGKMIISDFSQEGFLLADKVHQADGGQHTRIGVSLNDIKKYLIQKGFHIDETQTRFQETLICYK